MSEQKCVVCGKGRGDLPQTCAKCVARVRSHLSETERLYALLPAAIMVTAGKSGSLVGGIPSAEPPLLGGAALVLLSPGSWATNQARDIISGRHEWGSHAGDEYPGDTLSVLGELEAWERDWRHTLGLRPAVDAATVNGCGLFLQRNLDVVAQNADSAFDEFADMMRKLVGQLRQATSEGEAIDRGRRLACEECGEPLVRRYRKPSRCEHAGLHCDHSHPHPSRWPCRGSNTCACDQGGRTDDWVCSSRSCETEVDDASYWLRVKERYEQKRREALTCDNEEREAC